MNNQKKKIIYTYLSCAVITLHIILHLYIHLLLLDVYNLIMKSINKLIKAIIFLQFIKSQFLFSEKDLLHFLGIIFKFFFYKTFDISLA